MVDEIKEILEKKNINDEFIQELIISYIVKHDSLFGEIVPTSELIERLKENLDNVEFVYPVPEDLNECTAGCYEGFEKNKITMFFTKEHLKDETLKNDFKGIFYHELTHCLYNKKNNNYAKTETQVFIEYEKIDYFISPFTHEKIENYIYKRGNDYFLEPIVNYVSSIIHGEINGVYLLATISIRRLANKVGVYNIVKSAFYSDEEYFKSLFSDFGEDAYENFAKGLGLQLSNKSSWQDSGKRFINRVLNNDNNKLKM